MVDQLVEQSVDRMDNSLDEMLVSMKAVLMVVLTASRLGY